MNYSKHITVCAEIFMVLNFRGFRGMLGHPRKFNPSLAS